ncbi:MAG: hypothetical protein HOI53_10200 [Francisellaceae bacterium]|nr:hypothetical protein [Francisellaceae bacterium]MBT6539018.1 hypothetical protein [Francisellaceae bacterium]
MSEYVWQFLELEETNNIFLIKKAYKKLLKKFQIEQKPESLLELNDIYAQAINLAKHEINTESEHDTTHDGIINSNEMDYQTISKLQKSIDNKSEIDVLSNILANQENINLNLVDGISDDITEYDCTDDILHKDESLLFTIDSVDMTDVYELDNEDECEIEHNEEIQNSILELLEDDKLRNNIEVWQELLTQKTLIDIEEFQSLKKCLLKEMILNEVCDSNSQFFIKNHEIILYIAKVFHLNTDCIGAYTNSKNLPIDLVDKFYDGVDVAEAIRNDSLLVEILDVAHELHIDFQQMLKDVFIFEFAEGDAYIKDKVITRVSKFKNKYKSSKAIRKYLSWNFYNLTLINKWPGRNACLVNGSYYKVLLKEFGISNSSIKKYLPKENRKIFQSFLDKHSYRYKIFSILKSYFVWVIIFRIIIAVYDYATVKFAL